ncbi:hypothetical protein GCM10023229_32450 [Flavisolibacter ginsenosidimutans]
MKDAQILNKLGEITHETWRAAIQKCHDHMDTKLWGKTASGAHCEQRLGMDAKDYYLGKAIKALYEGTWEWKYEEFPIDEQLIRIINSMISEQVRKYKIEVKKGKKTVLVENEQLALSLDEEVDKEYDESQLQKLSTALTMACEGNEQYQALVKFKKQGLSYNEISTEMNCDKEELYRMIENIGKRAKRILKSL